MGQEQPRSPDHVPIERAPRASALTYTPSQQPPFPLIQWGRLRLEGRWRHRSQQVERAASLRRYLIRESIEAGAHGVTAAELGGLEAADDVLERRSHYKVLLLQPQLLPLKELGTVEGRGESRC